MKMIKKPQKEIVNMVNCHKFISFDMFDTLVKRDCARPVELFHFVEKKVDSTFGVHSRFASQRVQAEKVARRKSTREEVTLGEIYSQLDLGISIGDMKQVEQWEEEYEYDFCQWNPFMRPVYDYCVAQHKKILIVTDIYLPKKLIEKILAKLGIHYDGLYVSSDKMMTKAVGSLFRCVLEEQHIKPSDMLHIGDNKKSDYEVPRKIGIDAVHIPTHVSLNLFMDKKAYKKSAAYADLCAFINNHASNHFWNAVHPDTPLDYFAQAGYEVEGPVLYGFVKWLQEQFKKDHIEKVFFLARDGQIMQKAYRMLADTLPDTYMYASRQALITPYLWMNPDLHDFERIMAWPFHLTIPSFLKRIGLDADCSLERYQKAGFDVTKKYSWHGLLKDKHFLEVYENHVKEPMVEQSKQQYEYLLRYLRQVGFEGNVAIVDIGWFGHMQAALQKVAEAGHVPANVHGYYLALRAESPVLDEIKGKGYLFDRGFHEDMSHKEELFNCIVEALFTANHGTTKGYRAEGTEIRPVLAEWEYGTESSKEDYRRIHRAQEGALAFVEDALHGNPSLQLSTDPAVTFSNWLQLGCHPSSRCAELFGRLHILDVEVHSFVSSLVSPWNWKSFLIGLRDSYWRIGYLTQAWGERIPSFRIYEIMRKLGKESRFMLTLFRNMGGGR